MNWKDEEGWTAHAVDDACERNLEIVRLLLEYDADVKLENGSGETALMFVERWVDCSDEDEVGWGKEIMELLERYDKSSL